MTKFRYQLGDKVYIQKPLVLGQIRQLMELLKGMTIPGVFKVSDLIALLGDKLPVVLAIVLTEEGKSPKDKDLSAFAEAIEFGMDADTAFRVIDNFFDCNPVQSLLERLQGIGGNIRAKIGSGKSVYTSPEETSQSETVSYGDIPLKSADPISSIV